MDPYIGEIRMFGGNFAPANWALCDGSLQPISGNDALYSLIGNTYGGDGQTTFALPDLRGRIPIRLNSNTHPLGQMGGAESVTLTVNQIPAHSHQARGQSTDGTEISPEGAVWAKSTLTMYTPGNSNAVMRAASTTLAGGSQPHDNMMPFLCVNYIISLVGIYPSFE